MLVWRVNPSHRDGIPILLQKSTEMASTVSYRSCLSLSVMIEDIQFAESFISAISPMGAERIFGLLLPQQSFLKLRRYELRLGIFTIAMASP